MQGSLQLKKWSRSTWQRFGTAHWFLVVVFYAIASNVPYWAASYLIGLLPLGWLCLEYTGAGLIALYVSRKAAAVVLLGLIGVDLTCGVSKTYYLAPTDCFKNSGYLHELPGTRLLAVTAVGILTVMVASIAAFLPGSELRGANRRRAAVWLLAFATIVVSFDFIAVLRETGHLPRSLYWFTTATFVDSNRSNDYKNLWASRYPIIRIVRCEKLYGQTSIAFGSLADHPSVPSATGQAVELSGIGENGSVRGLPNLVVIVVESWGICKDPSIRNALIQSYFQPSILSRYRVLQGAVRFYGSTVAAEGRELCGRKIGAQIEDASTRDLQGCLPHRLGALGYRTIGLHGMDQEMFRRKTWYRSIGFQEEWFRDRFREQGLPDCPGAFVGTCDASVADWIGDRLSTTNEQPYFVHWMTLNSHLPLPAPSAGSTGGSCAGSQLLAQSPSFCSWYQLVAKVHSSVSRLAMTKLSRPTVFVVVGDHAPPFSNPAVRNEFSNVDVPFVILLPKSVDAHVTHAAN